MRQLTERETHALERGRQKAELVAWMRREAASRDGIMSWYVARTNGRADVVSKELERHGIECMCPMWRTWKRYPRRNARYSVDIPFFGNYLFVRLLEAESAWVGLLTFDGIACLQGTGERPVPLREKEVRQIIDLVGQEKPASKPCVDALLPGDRVVHPVGLLAELEAVVSSVDAEKREAIVSTMLFGREMSTRCRIDDLERL